MLLLITIIIYNYNLKSKKLKIFLKVFSEINREETKKKLGNWLIFYWNIFKFLKDKSNFYDLTKQIKTVIFFFTIKMK